MDESAEAAAQRGGLCLFMLYGTERQKK